MKRENKLVREIRNQIDGPYRIISSDENAGKTGAASGFRQTESRVVRKLLDLGLAIPTQDEKKSGK